GQTAFVLSDIPADSTAVEMFVNGIKQRYGANYTVSGQNVTYLSDSFYSLDTSDEVEFWYLVSGLISGGGGGGGNQTFGQTLGVGNTSDGYDINLTMGSTIFATGGVVTIDDSALITGDLEIDGKLTVHGLID